MARLIAIIGMLLAAFLAVRWFATAPAAKAARTLRRAAGAGMIAAAGFLALRGVWSVAAPLALAGLAMMTGNPFAARGGSGKVDGGGNEGESGGRTSRVRTKMLLMELDHGTGRMEGRVLSGRFAGRELSGMTMAELRILHGECAAAGDRSLKLLETYLDRARPGWREAAPGGAREEGAMTPERAREILGLGPDADAEAVRAAHRRLMKGVHPDHGGSDWLARQLNEARDVLLKEAGGAA